MNQNIKDRIVALGKKAATEFFFGLIDELVTVLQLGPENEKLAINVRNDYQRRISVNLNGRLVLCIKDGDELGFMINEADMPKLEGKVVIKTQERFMEQSPQATFIYFNYQTAIDSIAIIQPLWLKSCSDYLPMQVRSQYRKHHIPELYELSQNKELLEYYFNASPILQPAIENKAKSNTMKHPLNQILFGPPGTGKTYNTIN